MQIATERYLKAFKRMQQVWIAHINRAHNPQTLIPEPQVTYELQSKLFKEGYIGDYIWKHYKAY